MRLPLVSFAAMAISVESVIEMEGMSAMDEFPEHNFADDFSFLKDDEEEKAPPIEDDDEELPLFYDESLEEGRLTNLNFNVNEAIIEVDSIYLTPIHAAEEEGSMLMDQWKIARRKVLNASGDSCEIRQKLYLLAREKQNITDEEKRLKQELCRMMDVVAERKEIQESFLARLDQQQRELNASERYQEHLETLKLEAIAARKAEQDRIAKEKASQKASGALAVRGPKPKKKKSGRNKKLMKAVNLKVEFGDDVMTFRVPWDYTITNLLEDCISMWRVDPASFVLEDGWDNVWPGDAVVTSEVIPKLGPQDDFDLSPKLVLVDKSVALSMFDRETDEEKAAKRAAAMVSTDFIGPLVEDLVAKSIRERLDLAKELGPYLIFIAVFLGCIFLKRNVFNSWVWTDSLKEYYVGESFPSEYKPNVNFAFEDIANSEEMYQWITGVFLPAMFDTEPGIVMRYSHVIGGFQMRTLRMANQHACGVPALYAEGLDTTDCWAPWDNNIENEDTEPYSELEEHTVLLPSPGHGHLQNVSLHPPKKETQTYRYHWNQNHVNSIALTSGATRITYPPDGYLINLPVDEHITNEAMAEFENAGFTDQGTRALIITMLLFNTNYNLFNYVNFLFEFDAGGLVTPSMQQKTFRMDTYGEPSWLARCIFDILYVYFIALLYKNMAVKIHKTYLKSASYLTYFKNTWNALDAMIAAVSTVYITFEIMNAFNPTKSEFDITTTQYVEMGTVAEAYELGAQLNAFNAFLVVMRTFEYLAISEPVQHLIRTLGLAAPECVSFTIVFMIIFYAFVLMAHAVFGFVDEEFCSMGDTTITLLIMQLGEFDYPNLVAANSFYAPLFFLLYNMVIVFVLLNVFIGIIGDAYEAARHIDNDPERPYLPSAGTLADDLGLMWKGIKIGVWEIFPRPNRKTNLVEQSKIAEEKRLAEEEAEKERLAEEEKQALIGKG